MNEGRTENDQVLKATLCNVAMCVGSPSFLPIHFYPGHRFLANWNRFCSGVHLYDSIHVGLDGNNIFLSSCQRATHSIRTFILVYVNYVLQ